MKKIKVAMLGAGLMAPSHMGTISKLGEQAELVAVADINETACREAAEKYGIPRQYNDAFRAIQEAEADAVIICIPNHLHAPVTLAALERAQHVLVEKPMALTL